MSISYELQCKIYLHMLKNALYIIIIMYTSLDLFDPIRSDPIRFRSMDRIESAEFGSNRLDSILQKSKIESNRPTRSSRESKIESDDSIRSSIQIEKNRIVDITDVM